MRQSRTTPPRILCVDDDPELLAGLRLCLERDHAVQTCPDPVAALGLLRGARFDVIVSDMRMPGLDGARFLAAAREMQPLARRILLTGYGDAASAASAVNDGRVSAFLEKPCAASALRAAIRAALEDKQREELVHDRVGRAGHEVANMLGVLTALTGELFRATELQVPPSAEIVQDLATATRQIEFELALLRAGVSGDAAPPRSVVDFGDLIRSLVSMLRTRFDVAIEVDVPSLPALVLSTASELVEVVVNLVKNACEAGAGRVTITVSATARSVRLWVQDDGSGIDPTVAERLFEPRVTSKAERGGSGLGLAIVAEIVRRHGGSVLARPGEQGGTVFEVDFPTVERGSRSTARLRAPLLRRNAWRSS